MYLFLIEIANTAVHAGVVILLYSTILLVPGLIVSYALRRFGVALQSVALRITLVFAIVLPVISLLWPYEHHTSFTIETVPTLNTLSKEAVFHSGYSIPLSTSLNYGAIDISHFNEAMIDDATYSHHPVTAYPENISNTEVAVVIPPEKTLPASSSDNAGENRSHVQGYNYIRLIVYCLFAVLWLCASFIFFVWYIGASISIHLLCKTAIPAKKEFTETCGEAASVLGVPTPAVLQSYRIHSPLAAGFFRPLVIMPLGDVEQKIDSREVFLHELAHLKNRDYLWNQIRYFATALFPFQPLFWILSKRMTELSDYVCDEIVVEKVSDRKKYAMTLFTLSFSVPETSMYKGIGDGFLSCKSSIRRRIERIIGYRHDANRLSTGMSYGFSIAVAAVVAFCGCFIGVETTMSGVSVLQAAVKAPSAARRALSRTLSSPRGGKLLGAVTAAATSEPERKVEINTNRDVHQDVSVENRPKLKKETAFAGGGVRQPDSPETAYHEAHTVIVKDTTVPPAEKSTSPNMTGDKYSLPAAWPDNDPLPDRTVTHWDSAGSDPGFSFVDSYLAIEAHDLPVFIDNTIQVPKPRELNVSVDFDYENYSYDFENVDDKHKYATYYGLAKRKNEPAWSPDGCWIAFTDQSRIWIVSVDGGAPKLVYENFQGKFSVGNIESLCFTPDSRELTFKKDIYDIERGSRIDIYDNRAVFSNPIPNIESVDIETGEHRRIVENGFNCAWSPNGRYLCYLLYDDNTNPEYRGMHGVPVLLDTRNGTKEFLDVDPDLRYGKPAFSPGGTHIVLPVRDGVEPIEFFSYEINRGGLEQLTFYSEDDGHGKYRNFPEISPDGLWIMYTDFTWTKDNPDKRLFVCQTLTGEIYRLIESEDTPHSYGKWSPDGTRICYLVERRDANYIYICDFVPESFGAQLTTGVTSFGPSAFELSQNYPNPFNFATTIDFSLPGDCLVTLDIFNSAGQKVRRLAGDEMRAGNHTLMWNGSDNSGNPVSSGLYFARLVAENHSRTVKMTLAK